MMMRALIVTLVTLPGERFIVMSFRLTMYILSIEASLDLNLNWPGVVKSATLPTTVIVAPTTAL